jgi:hypothetical protein
LKIIKKQGDAFWELKFFKRFFNRLRRHGACTWAPHQQYFAGDLKLESSESIAIF